MYILSFNVFHKIPNKPYMKIDLCALESVKYNVYPKVFPKVQWERKHLS